MKEKRERAGGKEGRKRYRREGRERGEGGGGRERGEAEGGRRRERRGGKGGGRERGRGTLNVDVVWFTGERGSMRELTTFSLEHKRLLIM